MLRQGKKEGWLTLSDSAFKQWALLNGVTFDHCDPGRIAGRGGGLLATKSLDNQVLTSSELLTLLHVPRDLVLGTDRIREHARADKDFREVLESIGEFGQTPRGAILTFLLFLATQSHPGLGGQFGLANSFTNYVKSLPQELLPTFWTTSELSLLIGTTLAPAISSKLKSLHREWDKLISSLPQTKWWKLTGDDLRFDDWLIVDAMYRSRALDFPGIGHCMVPCLDLANHTPHEATSCIYDLTSTGDVALLLRHGKKVEQGQEVTITYGDEKGACEMLFSYGFLDADMESAEALFLSLSIPDEDPLKLAKTQFADTAPGVKFIDAGEGEIEWKSDFIWLLCVNEEDGLEFKIAQLTDGESEMQAFWKDQRLIGAESGLCTILTKSDLWPVYRLRAAALLQQRVYDQLQVLFSTQDDVEAREPGESDGEDVRPEVFAKILQLRRLEFELLERAYETLEKEKCELAENEVVQRYLAEMNAPSGSAQAENNGSRRVTENSEADHDDDYDEDFS